MVGGRRHFDPDILARGGNGGQAGAGGGAGGGAIANFGALSVGGCIFSNSAAVGGPGAQGACGGFQITYLLTGLHSGGGAAGLASGGAIHSTVSAEITNSLFVSSYAAGGTGGAAPFCHYSGGTGSGASSPGGVALGGGLASTGTLQIVNCTFWANASAGGLGGSNACSFYQPSAMHLTNSGNAFGGAIFNGGFAVVRSVTFGSNTAISTPGYTNGACQGDSGNSFGGSIANTGTLQLVNSILDRGTSNNVFGSVIDLGHNISSDGTPSWTSGTSLNNTDPRLAPLANNGGATLTMALCVGSPALDNADPNASPSIDQRGFARPQGNGFDIGAYEGAGVPSLVLERGVPLHQISFAGEPGMSYRLETSVDLETWTQSMTNTTGVDGRVKFHVPANGPQQFYRVAPQ